MNLLRAGRLLLLDLASTVIFLAVVQLTKNVSLAIIAGMVFGLVQLGFALALRRPISVMQWMSLVLVLGFGAVSLITNDPRYVMIKPSLIYVIVGIVMLTPGWMNRYLPAIALALVPDVAVIFGFVWSGLMFLSAALNIVVALSLGVVRWAFFMSIYAILSKLGLFVIQYVVMRHIAIRRRAEL